MHLKSRGLAAIARKGLTIFLASILVFDGVPTAALAEALDAADAVMEEALVEEEVSEEEPPEGEPDALETSDAPSETESSELAEEAETAEAVLGAEESADIYDEEPEALVVEPSTDELADASEEAEPEAEAGVVDVPGAAEDHQEADGAESEDLGYSFAYRISEDGAAIVGYAHVVNDNGQVAVDEESSTGDVAFAVVTDDSSELVLMAASDDGYVLDEPTTFDPDLVIPSELGGLPVTAIGDSAFEDAGWLETVVVPEGVRSIGDSAFRGCASLRVASLPSTLGEVDPFVFCDCSSLASAELPEGVRFAERAEYPGSSGWSQSGPGAPHVGDRGLFQGCSSLAAASVPASLGYVGPRMFSGCSSLASVTLPEGISSVGDWAFSGCTSLASVSLPSSCASVGRYAFSSCPSLASASLPEGVVSLGDGAFLYDRSLSSVSLPSTLSEVGEAAFVTHQSWRTGEDGSVTYDCVPLEVRTSTWAQYWKVSGPRYVEPAYTTVLPPDGAPEGELEFEYAINPDGTLTITGCKVKATHLTIPSSINGYTVTAIGASAFKDEPNLKAVVLPETVTRVEEEAFAGCAQLAQVLLPTSVVEIDTTAFDSCDKLVVTCDEGSYASQFAVEQGIPSTSLISLSLAVARCAAEAPYAKDGAKPTVAVTVGEAVLTEGKDYSVVYASNDHLGIATATVEAIEGSGYEGCQYCAFTVVMGDVSAVTVNLPAASVTYTGKAQTPKPTVKDGEAMLDEGTDYTVAYKNNTKAGTATVTITGTGNYGGTTSVTFKINPKAISSAKVAAIANKAYTGSAIKPALTVKDGTRTLKSGTDYKVAYKNNVKVGTATVTITGLGNYRGTKSVTFKIVAASVAKATVSKVANQRYDGTAKRPTPTVKLGGKTLKKGTDYTLTYKNNVKPGTATVTIKGKGNYAGSKSVTFKVVAQKGTWTKVGSKWRYVWADKKYPKSVFLYISGKTYYFDANGYMAIGWKTINKKSYYFDSSGVMAKSKWVGDYYLKADGTMARNEWVDGGRYHVDKNGKYDKKR